MEKFKKVSLSIGKDVPFVIDLEKDYMDNCDNNFKGGGCCTGIYCDDCVLQSGYIFTAYKDSLKQPVMKFKVGDLVCSTGVGRGEVIRVDKFSSKPYCIDVGMVHLYFTESALVLELAVVLKVGDVVRVIAEDCSVGYEIVYIDNKFKTCFIDVDGINYCYEQHELVLVKENSTGNG